MSSGATVCKLPGTPSTKIKGAELPFKVAIPLNLICVPTVGSPEGAEMERPATLP